MENLHCVSEQELPDWAKPKTSKTPSEAKLQLLTAAKKFFFIIGTSLLAIASFRNSVTWHFQQFWGASKSLYENIWDLAFHGIFGGHKFLFATVGINSFLFVYFWLNGLFFLYLDIVKPKFAQKYKVQEVDQLNREKLLKAIRVCLINQFIALCCSVPLYMLGTFRNVTYEPKELPTFQWVLFELCIFILIEEVGFYYSHRAAHHPRIYKHIHKIHHEWTAPISIVCIYAHPLEHIFCNVLPISIGPIIMGSHLATALLWYCITLTSTHIAHGGYHLPFLPSPEAHDYHHLKFVNNFGTLGVLDRLHGTDNLFIKTKAYDRHIMLLGLAPAKELFPDDKIIKSK
ncbi:fatty acid hydroxylase domain-containing protein 2 isoform X2 [Hydra vulgaris]|uniref:Fatty acid hydroxylase domain-containing protein 2 isoform X2 n=1 Tax=Hydra vulgaris TaxID=6087 RepID=A0ABM4D7A2_HYDVU